MQEETDILKEVKNEEVGVLSINKARERAGQENAPVQNSRGITLADIDNAKDSVAGPGDMVKKDSEDSPVKVPKDKKNVISGEANWHLIA